jgi:adenylate kinase family enzyme
MKRISIVGTSGSGKSTLAEALAQQLQVPHIELDALHWQAGWQGAPPDVFAQRVEEAVSAECWTCSGNYSRVRERVWRRADTVVWLDYSFPLVMSRLLTRTLRRLRTQEELWNGNRESLAMMLSRDSVLLWGLKTYHRHRREYPLLMRCPEYAHLKIIRFTRPQQARTWLDKIRD